MGKSREDGIEAALAEIAALDVVPGKVTRWQQIMASDKLTVHEKEALERAVIGQTRTGALVAWLSSKGEEVTASTVTKWKNGKR